MKLEQLPELWELWSRLVSHCLPSLCLVGATEDRNGGSGFFWTHRGHTNPTRLRREE